MENTNRFDIIVNDGAVYENAEDLQENQMIRKDYDQHLAETLSGAEEQKVREVHYKAVTPAETRADYIQRIIFQEGSIIDYLADHEFPERIRVVCRSEDEATMYQMNYNFYYATEKTDRLGLEKWD